MKISGQLSSLPYIFSPIFDLLLPAITAAYYKIKISHTLSHSCTRRGRNYGACAQCTISLSPIQWEPSIDAQKVFRNSTGITGSNVLGFTSYYIYSASRGIVKSQSPPVRTQPNFEKIQVKEFGLKCFRYSRTLKKVWDRILQYNSCCQLKKPWSEQDRHRTHILITCTTREASELALSVN
jgi:hypothetical protein